MSVFIDKNTKLVIQGITGRDGSFHAKQMMEYGTQVVAAFQIITGDSTVKAILFNIFGGITRCDDVARGILTALDQMKIDVPLVIRLTGTNEELARQILAERGLTATTSMDEGVKAAIAAAQGGVQ